MTISPDYMHIKKSVPLKGTVNIDGAKNATLVIMTSSIIASGTSILKNVPFSSDVFQMITLLETLGAKIHFDYKTHTLTINSENMAPSPILPHLMHKMRASILVIGPLLARFKKAYAAQPGGCVLGARPIDFHLRAFQKMGVEITFDNNFINLFTQKLEPKTFILEYPSVGTTENILMAAACIQEKTTIINAAIEPEVLDLIEVLQKMGVNITIKVPGTIEIEGTATPKPVEHTIIGDRLEAGTLCLAAAITGGSITIPNAPSEYMSVFLEKLSEMGHMVSVSDSKIQLTASQCPQAVSFRTMPYPGFPTDLQAPMMVAQCNAQGTSIIYETVFENRLLHAHELQKMGAKININGPLIAQITGTPGLLKGTLMHASDIRSATACMLAGLIASGETKVTGINHLERGHANIHEKLNALGANINIHKNNHSSATSPLASSMSSRVT